MNDSMNSRQEGSESASVVPERRAVLKRMGRFALVTAPAVTMLLAARSKPAEAQVISLAPV